MDSDLTPLHWLHNIDIMGQCGFDDSQLNGKLNSVTVVDQTDYKTTNKKPPLSYSSLITKAIKSNPNNKLTLSQIYSWIKENYLYYSSAEPSWQNSIRHNLSLNKCFVKIPRGKDEPGKGGFWSLDESLVGRSGSKRKKKKKNKNLHNHNINNNISSNINNNINNNNDELANNNNLTNGLLSCTNHNSNSNLINNININLNSTSSNSSNLSTLSGSIVSNNNTIIVTHSDSEACTDICQDEPFTISTQGEIVESEIIESELILENVYWESVLDLDHLISIGEL